MLVKQLRKKKATKCFLWTVIAWWLLVHALLNCHYLQTEGVQGTGADPHKGYRLFLRAFFPPTGVVCFSKLSLITLQPKKEVPQWMVLYTAKPLLSLPTLLSLDPLPCYSKCDICTLCYVDMCQCVYVCVRVFFSTACVSCFRLGAEPFPMIGLLSL